MYIKTLNKGILHIYMFKAKSKGLQNPLFMYTGQNKRLPEISGKFYKFPLNI